MDERMFLAQADKQLANIEAALERVIAGSDVDIDFELKPGGVIEIELDDASKIIVNRHTAAREIWIAARSGGYHFRWDGSRWVNTRDGAELMDALARCLSEQAGKPIPLEDSA